MRRKPKPSTPRYAVHILHGRGEVLAVRTLDGGALVADVQFPDRPRVIKLDACYWQSDISGLLPTPPAKEKRARKRKPASAERPVADAHAPLVTEETVA